MTDDQDGTQLVQCAPPSPPPKPAQVLLPPSRTFLECIHAMPIVTCVRNSTASDTGNMATIEIQQYGNCNMGHPQVLTLKM